ncbi:STAS domain-containing protein [Streptomyces massasporeus]|uniref:STAS domain-containing protein n=1 Tax=Streptomyces massasporeus TaxID=67324 RepID=UPI003D9F0C2E
MPLRVVADLSGVTFMDSSGINTFVATYRQAKDADGWVSIAEVQQSVLRVLHLTGVDALITCYSNTAQTLTA